MKLKKESSINKYLEKIIAVIDKTFLKNDKSKNLNFIKIEWSKNLLNRIEQLTPLSFF